MKSKSTKTLILLLLLPFLLFALKTILDIRKSASGVPANIIINTQSLGTNINGSLWKNLAQGGEEAKDMIGPVATKLQSLQLQLIRIDHLFDYYQVDQGNGQYDFSRLDQAVNSILATGAKPMLSLSYTPDSKEPGDWNQWNRLIEATARHYSVEKNISGIYYEVWNEPDLFGGWHYGRSPNYLTLYKNTSLAVKRGAGNSSYKIGGPAITAYYNNWIKALFKFAAANNLPLDFISWHKYSFDSDDYVRDFENLNSILADYPQYFNIERLITEIGPNSEPDSAYDNSLSGIHLISLSTKLYGKIHRIFTFEAVDGPSARSDKSTGWGILSHSGQIKPRYQALQFLNQISGTQLAHEGDGTWVTSLSSKKGTTIQTLLVNYDPKLSHIETTPITYQGLTPGKYLLKTSQYLGKNNQKIIDVTGDHYTENIYLNPNTAYFLELTKN